MPNLAQRVAELIDAEAHSGSGAWDEVNGPDAELITENDTKSVITIPERYLGDDETENYCRITVEYVQPLCLPHGRALSAGHVKGRRTKTRARTRRSGVGPGSGNYPAGSKPSTRSIRARLRCPAHIRTPST